MQQTILVSLVSDQTIPNVLFIRDHPKADRYLFISTAAMEKKHSVQHIIKGSGGLIDNNYEIILVEEDSLVDFEKRLNQELKTEDGDHYLVNITGGTKIMSLGAFMYFTRIGSATIYYLPIGKSHFRQIFPIVKTKTKDILFRINLRDYLQSNGVAIQSKSFETKNHLIQSEAITESIFDSYLGENNPTLKRIGFELREKKARSKALARTEEISALIEPFTLLGFTSATADKISKEESQYLTGNWFEEFTYLRVKEILGKSDDEIGKGVIVTRGEKTSNEFDVMFTQNNALYVIECKTDVADDEEGKLSQLFTSTLYKASTLKKDFGLFVKYYLFAINDFSKLSVEQKDRARVLDIKLVGTEILSNPEKLRDYILNM